MARRGHRQKKRGKSSQPTAPSGYVAIPETVQKASDRIEEATAVYSDRLAREPDNPIARHMSAASTQVCIPSRAPDDFVQTTTGFTRTAKHMCAKRSQRLVSTSVTLC
jgi:hypothetical protein